jgi:hypothetical protein
MLVFYQFRQTSVARSVGPSVNGRPANVTTFSTDFSFQNLVFWNLLDFQRQKSLKNQCLSHSESKSYQINSIKSCSSRSFQQHQFLWNFQLGFSLIFSEEIIQYSKTSTLQVQMPWNQAHAPLLLESFWKRLRTQSKASLFSVSHKYKIKQNKQPSFIDKYQVYCSLGLVSTLTNE